MTRRLAVTAALLLCLSPTSILAMTAAKARSLGLFRSTPLIQSLPLTSLTGRDVYLKLDALQSSGSFKDRGMAHLCTTLADQGTRRLISSSGGNAGLAVATVGRQLGLEVRVIVPTTTKELIVEKLRRLGADVTVEGDNWNAADLVARQWVAEDESAAYVSPYDNPLLWTGHSTLVDEIVEELEQPPAALIVSVGGGGLLCGVLEGLARHEATATAVLAAETEGAASFGKAFQQGKIVRLDAIASVATSLGALEVTPVALERAKKHMEQGGMVKEALSTDAEAVDACLQFAADHRILVEPACGAALACLYSPRLRAMLADIDDGPVVVEVCGGSGVNLDLLAQWKKDHPL